MDLSNYDNRNFDRGAPLWKEALWRMTQGFFFQAMWPVPNGWRVNLLRLFGAKLGKGVVIRAGVNISFPWRLRTGDHVWFGEEVMILSLAPVTIGSNVCLSQRCFLRTGSHDPHSKAFELVTKEITISDQSWIGAQAWIGPGVRIDECSVIAAGSIVNRNVPPGRLYAGNPAIDKGPSRTDL